MTNRKSRSSANSSQSSSLSADQSAKNNKNVSRVRRDVLRGLLVEHLERRELMAADYIRAVFAPGTTDAYRTQFNDTENNGFIGSGVLNGLTGQLTTGARWSNPVGGASQNSGDPSIVTWSIVPDGTINANDNQPSNLIAFMDSLYGGGTGPISNRPWFNLFQRAYDQWAQQTGLTFVYEANDDGSPYAGNATNRGVAGQRGDMRIGGNNLDGNSNALAYGFYPSGNGVSGWDGDLVIDTNDSWFAQNVQAAPLENRAMVNVLAQGIGHGIGMNYSQPMNGTKLMEPIVSNAFLGVQHNDLVGALGLYGDNRESNNTNLTAVDLGGLTNGVLSLNRLAISSSTDADWFKFRVPSSGSLGVSVTPVGFRYLLGSDGGPAPVEVDSLRFADLALSVIAADGTVLRTANTNLAGLAEEILALQLPSAGEYSIRVTGVGANPQIYNLRLQLQGIRDPQAATSAPRLLSVAPNSGEIFSITPPGNPVLTTLNMQNESPTELTFRFDGDQQLNPDTLAGIRIIRSGGDNTFDGTNDVVIVPGYLGFGENQRIVIARFSSPLPDDLYRIEILGEDVNGLPAVRNINGEALIPRVAGTDRDTYFFNVELGVQVIAVVPQPASANAAGLVVQQDNVIDVYFDANSDKLALGTINTDLATRQKFQLIWTRDSVTPNDDVVTFPDQVLYNSAENKVSLVFGGAIESFAAGAGTFRLRIGTDRLAPSAATPATPILIDLTATEVGGTRSNASTSIPTVTGNYSAVIRQEVRVVNPSDRLPLDYPGSQSDPGNRDTQDEGHIAVGYSADASPQITKRFYSFLEGQSYGVDTLGRPVTTSISELQKQRIREVFEFYSAYLGIDFVETTGLIAPDGSTTLQVVVGDLLGPVIGVSGPGTFVSSVTKSLVDNPLDNILNLAILDNSEPWDNEFGLGTQADRSSPNWMADWRLAQLYLQQLNLPLDLNNPNFFIEAMRAIGALLGLGQSNDLPPGTVQGFDPLLGRIENPIEQILPGDHDIVHGQYLYRPDNRDIDLYRFEVAAGLSGTFSAETVAERLMNSSDVDTHLTLLQEYTDSHGRLRTRVIATNDDYFSNDSFLSLQLSTGVYYIAVVASGNQNFDADVAGSGSGGTSQGRYELRVDFRPNESAANVLRDTAGTPIDGDGDGKAGGRFDFWFRAAAPAGVAATGAPRTLFVSKQFNGSTQTGSKNQPFNTISAAVAAARTGDIIRIVANGGLDNDVSTIANNRAYEIGNGGPVIGTLSDGANLIVPQGVTLMIEPGVNFKMGGSRILVGSNDTTSDRSGAAIQVLGTPDRRVVFTSYTDQSVGIDTNPLQTVPQRGDWGGIEIRNDFDNSQGRLNRERQGAFLNFISNADFNYGGGQVFVGGTPVSVNPIDLSEARAAIINNRITNSAGAAIAADPNTFEETLFTEPRYQGNAYFTPDYSRVGPVIRGNSLTNNTINGLFVRVVTLAGQDPKELTVTGRIDDTEITIVLADNVVVRGTAGGAVAETAGPQVQLVIGSAQTTTGANPGLPAGTYRYMMTFVDAFGSESMTSAVFGTTTLASTQSIRLTNLPAAPGDYVGRRLYRSNDGVNYVLAAELNRQAATFIDQGLSLVGGPTTNGLPFIQRARRDATLVIDPGVVVKSQGSRIEVGLGATMIAEGTDAKPIVFTSTRDDRYGKAESFDTNGDGVNFTAAVAGDWSGIFARHLSKLSIDSAIISFGGGSSSVPGGFASFNAIEVHQAEARIANSIIENNASGVGDPGTTRRAARGVNDAAAIFVLGSQPIIVDNIIRNNSGISSTYLAQFRQNGETAAISIDPNSMKSTPKTDYGRSIGLAFATEYDEGNLGPLVKGNRLGGNAINGMRVRGGTLTTEAVWDDTDIVHVLQKEIIVPDFHTYGGLRLQSSVGESLVVKLQGQNAGFTANGRPLDITDRIGGSLHVVGSPGFPVIMTSLRDDTVGAGFDFAGRSMLDTNNDQASTVAAPGDWRSIRLDAYSNDRNVQATYEFESRNPTAIGLNSVVANAQEIGTLAPSLSGGDENLRLGITVTGSIAARSDRDVYKFSATAGSMVWFDIDQTSADLDAVLELIDADGRIIAQSNNAITESLSRNTLDPIANVWFDPDLVDNGQVYPLDQSAYATINANANAAVDFQSVNPLDPGFRMVLPGTPGTRNDYYVRVRSSNLLPGESPDKLRDPVQAPLHLNQGLSSGSYVLQLRLQQQNEVAGSTVRYATVRYATTGIEVLGGPLRSPLVGDFSETSPNETQTGAGSAVNLGNILEQDRGSVSIAGNFATAGDVDWFRFTVQRQLSSNFTSQYHTSVVFDIDYADALGRPNTNLWVFESTNGTPTNLVLVGRDSNVTDDKAAARQGSNAGDLTRGSFGSGDAFIGMAELPPGEYMVAVTNNTQTSSILQIYEQNAITGAVSDLTRLEPIDSIVRIAEDRFGGTVVSNPAPARQVAFSSAADNAIPYTLADVNLYVGRTNPNNGNQSQLLIGNAMTGAKEAQGSAGFGGIFSAARVNDIAASPLGNIVGANVLPNGLINDNTTNNFTNVPVGGGAATVNNSGIQTFYAQFNATGNPEVIRAVDASGQQNGIGLDFTALSFAQNPLDNSLALFGVAHRADRQDFERAVLINQNNAPAFLPTDPRLPNLSYIIPAVNDESDPNYIGGFRNILYRLDPNTQAGISPPNIGNRPGLATATGTGTQVREYGIFAEVVTYTRSNLIGDRIVVIREATGDIVGITQIGNFIYGVTSTGELWRMTATNWSNGFQGAQLIATNIPNGLTGLTRGPRNLPYTLTTNETILSVPTNTIAGTLILSVLGSNTAPLPYNATAAQVQAALAALPGIGAGNVTVTGGPLATSPLRIQFLNGLGTPPVTVPFDTLVTSAPSPVLTTSLTEPNAVANWFDLYIDRLGTGNIGLVVNGTQFQAAANDAAFSSAANIEAAINGLGTVTDVAARAVVTQVRPNYYRVTFVGDGANTLNLTATGSAAVNRTGAGINEVDRAVDLRIIEPTQPTPLTLTGNGQTRQVLIPANATAAVVTATINTVLGIDPDIPSYAVAIDIGNNTFRIAFNGGLVPAVNIQPTAIGSTSSQFVFSIATPTTQSRVIIRNTNGGSREVFIPANASLAQIQAAFDDAMDDAPALLPATSATIIPGTAANTYNVVFSGLLAADLHLEGVVNPQTTTTVPPALVTPNGVARFTLNIGTPGQVSTVVVNGIAGSPNVGLPINATADQVEAEIQAAIDAAAPGTPIRVSVYGGPGAFTGAFSSTTGNVTLGGVTNATTTNVFLESPAFTVYQFDIANVAQTSEVRFQDVTNPLINFPVSFPANATDTQVQNAFNAVLAANPGINATATVVRSSVSGQFFVAFAGPQATLLRIVGSTPITPTTMEGFDVVISPVNQTSQIRIRDVNNPTVDLLVNVPANATATTLTAALSAAIPGSLNATPVVTGSNGVFRISFTTLTAPIQPNRNVRVLGTSGSTVTQVASPTITGYRLTFDPAIRSGTFQLQLGTDVTADIPIVTSGIFVNEVATANNIRTALAALPGFSSIPTQNITLNVRPVDSATVGGAARLIDVSFAGPSANLVGALSIVNSNVFGQQVDATVVNGQSITSFSDVMFAITPNGTIHAFDVNGGGQAIFPGSITSTVTLAAGADSNGLSSGGAAGSDVAGLDFGVLDVNLWHDTQTRGDDDGHGILETFNLSRGAAPGGTSLRFGFRDNSVAQRQPGTWTGIHNIATGIGADVGNGNFNVPGGARGALESNPIDLSGYAPDDLPTLYFNYFLETEAANSNGADNAVMRDAFRVYGLSPTGWILLATNNSVGNTDQNLNATPGIHEYDVPVSQHQDAFGRSFRTQELFDEPGRSGAWRQARVNLSALAGMKDTLLRFEFSTGGDFRTGDPLRGGIELIAKPGADFRANDSFSIQPIGSPTPLVFQFRVGAEAAIPGATQIPILATDTATDVRDKIRLALAQRINGNTNMAAFPVYGNTVVVYRATVVNQGAIRAVGAFDRAGDLFGPYGGISLPLDPINSSPTAAKNFDRAMQMAGANNFEGVYIDDIIIGFAERGEQILHPTGNAGGAVFVQNQFYESLGGPLGTRAEEVELGTYQLEIRTAREYGIQGIGRILPDYGQLGTPTRVMDTNDRITQQPSIVVSRTVDVVDGEQFTVSDGINTVVFEFDTNGVVSPGTVRVPLVLPTLNAEARSGIVAAAIRDAINGPTAQSFIKVTAGLRGQMITALGADLHTNASNVVELFGNVAGDLFGSRSFSNSPALSSIFAGDDLPYGQDQTDSNPRNEQGQVLIDSNTILDSANYGILVAAGLQFRNDLGANVQPRPYPGAVRNLVNLNTENLTPGPVVANNVVARGGLGGIRIAGDAGTGSSVPPIFVTRVYNNTLYGGSTVTGTGILVEQATSPTLLNNIVSNFTTGVSVINGATAVAGSNLYQGNTTHRNGIGAGTFDIVLGANEPLFADTTNNRFYLAANSRAIDSSISSLPERPGITNVKNGVQLPTSPLQAPTFDVGGLRRVDDSTVNTPAAQGENVFIDRGAVDRSDFFGPGVTLIQPIDNDLAQSDLDPNVSFVRLAAGSDPIAYFELLIDERLGTGPDPTTVTAGNVIVTENGRVLTPGVDYEFGYSVNSRTIRITPLSGFWPEGNVYEILLNNRNRFIFDVPNAAAIADGDQFSVVDSLGGRVVFEFETGYQLNLPTSPRLFVPATGGRPSGIGDADRFTITANGQRVTFELDNNNFVVTGNVGIPYLVTDSQAQLTQKIVAAIQASVLGITPVVLSDGSIGLDGAPTIQIDLSASALTQPAQSLSLAVPTAAAFVDGQTFTLSDSRSTFRFEIDTNGITTGGNVPVSLAGTSTAAEVAARITAAIIASDLQANPLQVGSLVALGLPASGQVSVAGTPLTVVGTNRNIVDGQTVRITNGVNTVTFEFDSNGSVTAPNVPVAIGTNQTPFELASALAQAINGSTLGVSAQALIDGAVKFNGSNALTFDFAGATNIYLNGTPGVTPQTTLSVNTVPVDGEYFTIVRNGVSIEFEFENTTVNNSRVLSRTPILYNNASTAADVAGAIAAAIRSSALAMDSTVTGSTLVFDDNARTTYNFTTSPSLVRTGIAGGVIPVLLSSDGSVDSAQVAAAIVRALRNATLPTNPDRYDTSLIARVIGNDQILFENAVSVDSPVILTSFLPGIKDLAGNFLQPNRVNGETQFTILMPGISLDYGDAADPFTAPGRYPTLNASGGASHVVFEGGVTLGANVSTETDAFASTDGLGDSRDNGVLFGSAAVFPAGFESSGLISNQIQNTVTVTLSKPGFVDAWIDFNWDGDWDDFGEQVLRSEEFFEGNLTRTFTIQVPQGFVRPLTPQFSFARFRTSAEGGLSPVGLATSGEVEDYRVTILPRSFAPTLVAPLPDLPAVEDVQPAAITLSPTYFRDPDSFDVLSFSASSSDASIATASIVNGQLVLNLVPNRFGQVTITVTATDLTGQSISDSFVLDIVGQNDDPIGNPDVYNVAVNRFASFNDPLGLLNQSDLDDGVLKNDVDVDGDTLTAQIVTGPSLGTLTFNSNGTFTYRPGAGAVIGGTDTFTYRALDGRGGQSSPVTVTINFTERAISPHHNRAYPTDVEPGTTPGVTSSIDLLSIVNLLSEYRKTGGTGPSFKPGSPTTGPILVENLNYSPAPFRDVNNDFIISALDMLPIVEELRRISQRNRSGGEAAPGVGSSSVTSSTVTDSLVLSAVTQEIVVAPQVSPTSSVLNSVTTTSVNPAVETLPVNVVASINSAVNAASQSVSLDSAFAEYGTEEDDESIDFEFASASVSPNAFDDALIDLDDLPNRKKR